ncbi:MAG: hypothetical protein ABI120_20655 [Gemmatimonadaceae bacterium]
MSSLRLHVACVLVAIATVTACSDDNGTVASSHPWKGECNLVGNLTNATTLVVTGTCQLNGLGAAAYLSTQTLNNTASTFASTTTFTLANGDILRSTNTGSTAGTANGLTVTGNESAIGGTGQFANATGSAVYTGAVTFTGATTTSGNITYDGTLRY